MATRRVDFAPPGSRTKRKRGAPTKRKRRQTRVKAEQQAAREWQARAGTLDRRRVPHSLADA